MSIDVNDESGFAPGIDLKEVSDLATFVLDSMRVHPAAELNVLLENEEAMAWRGPPTSCPSQWMSFDPRR